MFLDQVSIFGVNWEGNVIYFTENITGLRIGVIFRNDINIFVFESLQKSITSFSFIKGYEFLIIRITEVFFVDRINKIFKIVYIYIYIYL